MNRITYNNIGGSVADLDYKNMEISSIPVFLYTEYINLQFNNYLKKNFKDITPGSFMYLINIFYHQNISQRELAELLFVSESSVAQIIKKLEKDGLIVRTPDEKNKSRKILNITEKGKIILFAILKDAYEWQGKFFSNYSQKEIETFKKMIYDYSQKSIN